MVTSDNGTVPKFKDKIMISGLVVLAAFVEDILVEDA